MASVAWWLLGAVDTWVPDVLLRRGIEGLAILMQEGPAFIALAVLFVFAVYGYAWLGPMLSSVGYTPSGRAAVALLGGSIGAAWLAAGLALATPVWGVIALGCVAAAEALGYYLANENLKPARPPMPRPARALLVAIPCLFTATFLAGSLPFVIPDDNLESWPGPTQWTLVGEAERTAVVPGQALALVVQSPMQVSTEAVDVPSAASWLNVTVTGQGEADIASIDVLQDGAWHPYQPMGDGAALNRATFGQGPVRVTLSATPGTSDRQLEVHFVFQQALAMQCTALNGGEPRCLETGEVLGD